MLTPLLTATESIRPQALRLLVAALSFFASAPETPPPPAPTAPAAAPAAASTAVSSAAPSTLAALGRWVRLPTEPYRGKQDDLSFISPEVGWYVNGSGKIFATTDGGATWKQQIHKPGTFFRCIAFLSEQVGFAGNIGPDYFPNVSDATPLYRTSDGGATWSPVTISGDPVKGLCAIEIVRYPYINAGQLDHKTLLVAAGRVGGPTSLLFSHDSGETWTAKDMSAHCGMILDVHFFSDKVGLLAAATSSDVQQSSALILRTEDGGTTWKEVYRSSRPFETTWKISFPTAEVGFVSVQSYNPDPAAAQRFVAKTTDGGRTFVEVPLVSNHAVRQFGIGFISPSVGWVGATPHGFLTTDGGQTWTQADFGNATNKIRILHRPDGSAVVYALGVHLYKLELPAGTVPERK
jgi:photosystem II stability/assembly factor-like uncharacterized protein